MKGAGLRPAKIPPRGTASLHPPAIETMVEATKLSQLSVLKVARRLEQHRGHTRAMEPVSWKGLSSGKVE